MTDDTVIRTSKTNDEMRQRMLRDEELSEEEFKARAHRIALEAHEDRLKLWESLHTDPRTGARLSDETDSTLRRVAQHILEEARNAFPANHCLVPRVLIGTLREALREPKVAYNSNGDAYLVEPKVVVEQPNDPEPVECPVCRQMTLWPGTCAGTKDGSHGMPAQNGTAG